VQVVVGLVLLGRGRVLAARRAGPPEVAGGWEFPGGKVEPRESAEDAVVREIREELGVQVAVTGWLDGEQQIRAGLVLRVATGRLVAGELVPHEHDLVRWLRGDELDTVRWLPADRPFLTQVRRLLAVPC
jgi:8-oxo-dGTP diphosphatase